MYSLAGHAAMVADRRRVEAYAAALGRVTTPRSVVLDLGTGTGILALLACRAGARRVYALEASDVIAFARELAAANGCADRIEFVEGLSTEICLPERADVVVSDVRGVLPLYEGTIPALVDARERLLAAGGTMIPRSDTIWAAAVEAPDLHAHVVGPWSGNWHGLDLGRGRRLATSRVCQARLEPETLLTAPVAMAALNYTTVKCADLSARATWKTARAGTCHGLLLWFDSVLAEGVELSNAPGAPALIYGQAFFPLAEPVVVDPADQVVATIEARLVGPRYVWRWRTTTLGARGVRTFDQSTLGGAPLSLRRLRKRAASFAPLASNDAEIDRAILASMDGRRSLGEIAADVSARWPSAFPTWQQALARVADLSERYSR